jgi:hypothetical protein
MIRPLFNLRPCRTCLARVKFQTLLLACLLGTFRMIFTLLANCPNQLLVRRIIAFLSNQRQAYYALSSGSFR